MCQAGSWIFKWCRGKSSLNVKLEAEEDIEGRVSERGHLRKRNREESPELRPYNPRLSPCIVSNGPSG